MKNEELPIHKRHRIIGDVLSERRCQQKQGKSDHHPALWWFTILSYQMGLISQEFSQALFREGSLATRPGAEDVEINHDALRLGLVRVMAVALAWLEDKRMTAQEFIDAVIHDREELHGKTVIAYGRTYTLNLEVLFDDDQPTEDWEIALIDSPQQKYAKLSNELTALRRDPIGHYVAQRQKELEREIRRVERPNGS